MQEPQVGDTVICEYETWDGETIRREEEVVGIDGPQVHFEPDEGFDETFVRIEAFETGLWEVA